MHAFNDVYLFALQIINTERGEGGLHCITNMFHTQTFDVFLLLSIYMHQCLICAYIFMVYMYSEWGKKPHTMYSYFVDMLFG